MTGLTEADRKAERCQARRDDNVDAGVSVLARQVKGKGDEGKGGRGGKGGQGERGRGEKGLRETGARGDGIRDGSRRGGEGVVRR